MNNRPSSPTWMSAPASPHVVRVNVKPEADHEHGLPKAAVERAEFTVHGVTGDFNRYRHEEKRDDPAMAVLLVPIETIEELNREGWPVAPGDLGENVTTAGILPEALAAGRRLRVGPVTLEISKPCTPCDNLYLLPYVGSDRGAEFLRTMLDRRGWYARVVVGGPVRPGDPISLVPE